MVILFLDLNSHLKIVGGAAKIQRPGKQQPHNEVKERDSIILIIIIQE
jgi:hypothetical protein